MILSHHGKLEFGSPKVPLFPEALLLHYLDDMDSKMECMRAAAEKGAMAEGLFTAWSSPLERVVLRKDRYMAGAAACEPESGAQPASEGEPVLTGNGSEFGDKLRTALAGGQLPDAERNHENA
jgi:3'-5' exoribonuclease